MNKIIIYSILIFSVFFVSSSKKKAKKKSPPGTIYLKDNLFIDKSPIRIIDLKEMEYFYKRINFNDKCFKEIVDSLPIIIKYDYFRDLISNCNSNLLDSLKFTYTIPNIDSMQYIPVEYINYTDLNNYQHHPMFDDFPIVNIEFDLAKRYCNWRSYVVNLKNKTKFKKNNFKKVFYRIPTIEEYKYSFEKYMEQISNIDTLVLNNTIGDSEYSNSRKTKLYFNNISEYTSTKGISIGSNFNDSLKIKDLSLINHYQRKETSIGFRCICEIIQ